MGLLFHLSTNRGDPARVSVAARASGCGTANRVVAIPTATEPGCSAQLGGPIRPIGSTRCVHPIKPVGSTRHARPRAAFTLPEALMAVAVTALAVASITMAVSAGTMIADETQRELRAAMLANSLIEEILSKHYLDPQNNDPDRFGTDDAETHRGLYDDIDDYDGYHEDADELYNALGVLYDEHWQNHQRTVTIIPESMAGPDAQAVTGRRVVIDIQDDRGRTWSLSRFIPEPQE